MTGGRARLIWKRYAARGKRKVDDVCWTSGVRVLPKLTSWSPVLRGLSNRMTYTTFFVIHRSKAS